MADKQTDTKDRPKGASEDESQGSDLTALLQQYHQETGDKDSKDHLRVLESLKPVVDFAKQQMSKNEQDEVNQSIDNAYKFVTEEKALKGLNKTIVRGFLEAYGVENPRFYEAFRDQRKDPDTWKSELAKGRDWVKGQYEELLKGVGKSDIRSDLEAAKAAVAGTSTDDDPGDKVDAQKLFDMSDSDFDKFMRSELAKASR